MLKTLIKMFAVASLLTSTQMSLSDEVKLPERMPDLKVTEQQSLGTLEAGFGLAPGERVNDFEINDHFGKASKFKKLRKSSPLLVIFYRGGWCPYCNRQIYQLTEAWNEFEKRGVLPVLISVDNPDAAALASRTYEIPFPVLSDPTLVAHDIFKVTMTPGEERLKRFEEFGINLADWSGEDHNSFAVSSAFLVNKKGRVLWSHSALDYTKRPSVAQLLSVIDQTL